MNDKDDPIQQLTAIPWYQSKVLQGIIVSGASQIVASLQSHGVIKIAPDIDFWVELAFQAIAILAAAYAFIARTHKPTPPVSLSKTNAEAINAANPNIPETSDATQTPPISSAIRPADSVSVPGTRSSTG